MKQKYTLVSNFQCLGVPLEQSKLVGPSTCLTFLSIQVNTEALLLRLPKEKLEQLKQELSYCSYSLENDHQKGTTKFDWSPSIHYKSNLTRKAIPEATICYAIYRISPWSPHSAKFCSQSRHHVVVLYLFAEKWNGISLLWDSHTLLPEFNGFSDASDSWGCGGYWGLHWFQFKWPDHLCALPITTKELIPVVVAAAIFAHQWKGHSVQFSVDNLAVVHILNSTYS